jgi:hypothetical protein
MNPNQIKTLQDFEAYIEGCINDYEAGVSTKIETIEYIIECVLLMVKKLQFDYDVACPICENRMKCAIKCNGDNFEVII